MSPPPPPPPPPPPLLPGDKIPPALNHSSPKPPIVSTRPEGCFLVNLLTFNGAPFKDHWAYWIPSPSRSEVGVVLHATGDVRNGFRLEIKRNYYHQYDNNIPTSIIPLQWVDGKHFDEEVMLNNGILKFDDTPVTGFELSASKIKAPEKSLNSADENVASRKKVVQRNCQTWIVESADQLVIDGIFNRDVAAFLHAIEQ